MIPELKDLFATWIAAVAAAINAVVTWIVTQRRIRLVEGEPDQFSAQVVSLVEDAALPPADIRLSSGRPEADFSREWQAALRGSHIELVMRPDRLLFRTVEFPKAAADFLDGMIRTQIDRLTPWTAADAVFGVTAPEPLAGGRIALTLAATSEQNIRPLLTFAASLGARSVTGLVEPGGDAQTVAPITVFARSLEDAVTAIDVPRLLRRTLLGASLAAAASLAIVTFVEGWLDAEQEELSRLSSQRRAAIHANQGGSSAATLLAKRKQTSPSIVLVLEAISRVLPDATHVTELRVDGDKLQLIGLTEDAPPLINLIEQSAQFSRATFFAPTTRDRGERGERFHIEARIKPHFGSGS